MTVHQFLRAPFLDSPEKTAYSRAPGNTGQKVHAQMETSAVLGHSSLPAQVAGRPLTLWIFPFRATTSPSCEGQDVAPVPLSPLFLGGKEPGASPEGRWLFPAGMTCSPSTLGATKILVKTKHHGIRTVDRESEVLLPALPLSLSPRRVTKVLWACFLICKIKVPITTISQGFV